MEFSILSRSKILTKFFLITIFVNSCKTPNLIGNYKGTYGIAIYNLEIKRDSTYTFKVLTQPQELNSVGKWRMRKGAIFLFSNIPDKPLMNNKLPVKKNIWTYEFNGEKVRVKKRELLFNDTTIKQTIKLKRQ